MNEEKQGISKAWKETLSRIAIAELYCRTDYYINRKEAARKALITLLGEYRLEFSGATPPMYKKIWKNFQNKSREILKVLTDRTGVHHVCFVEPDYSDLTLLANFEAESLPFEEKLSQESLTMSYDQTKKSVTLSFDPKRNIDDQLESAKQKLLSKRQVISGGAFIKGSSEKKPLDRIIQELFIYVQREESQHSKKTWKDLADELDLKMGTAQKKFKKAKNLILSGEIRKYLPPQAPSDTILIK